MNIKEKAKWFAIQAHMGQKRKSEPDKPMIIHPLSVGNMLESYGYDDYVIAAGYLHDVVEDTKYSIEDIEKFFGHEIATLVMGASEPDKSLSWEERKRHTIVTTRNLPLRNKLVICADKINNLEDINIQIQKTGIRDFSAFKRGENEQRWYYTNVYESLIYNENANLPIFVRLKNTIDTVFNKKENTYLQDVIFQDNQEYYHELKKLHAQKLELQRLKALAELSQPFVIEFCGTPRTGKTTTINNLYDFFKKGGFKTTLIEEFTTSNYYKQIFSPQYQHLSSKERNILIIEAVTKRLKETLQSDYDIILIDRSINDRQIWNYRRYLKGDFSKEEYEQLQEKYRLLSQQLIDLLVITYASPLTSLKRDYLHSLALEERNFLKESNIEEYNQSLEALKPLLNSSVNHNLIIDTSNISTNDVALTTAKETMPLVRQKLLKSIKDKYNLS